MNFVNLSAVMVARYEYGHWKAVAVFDHHGDRRPISSARGTVISKALIVGFRYLNTVQRVSLVVQFVDEVVEQIPCDVFRRGVQYLEGLMFIEVAVVDCIDDFLDVFFQYGEVDTHAKMIEFRGPHRHFYLPVVAMRFFAIARVIAQMMSSGEVCFYKYVVHLSAPEDLAGFAGIQEKPMVGYCHWLIRYTTLVSSHFSVSRLTAPVWSCYSSHAGWRDPVVHHYIIFIPATYQEKDNKFSIGKSEGCRRIDHKWPTVHPFYLSGLLVRSRS